MWARDVKAGSKRLSQDPEMTGSPCTERFEEAVSKVLYGLEWWHDGL